MSINDEEAQRLIEDQCVLIDILQETLAERDAQILALKGQVKALMNGQKVNYEVA